ncbi:MAG: hypothetical protein K8J31_06640, partial [Anaerolineae bacterium]|nr:hypothetical protein [Anaerolineae bacterium]
KAMNGDLDLAQVYGKRLQAIRPTRGQLKAIEELYWEHIVPDAGAVLAALHYLEKTVFIISGGLAEPVRGFGKHLGVPPQNIRAVELEYNELAGDWWRYYEPRTQNTHTYLDYQVGPLTVSSGKPSMVQELAQGRPGRRLMIGDGMSDLVTRDVVDLFVGYGGVVARDKVRENAAAFIDSRSLAPVLPLAAGPSGYRRVIGTGHQAVFEKGIELALAGHLNLHPETLREDFEKAFEI